MLRRCLALAVVLLLRGGDAPVYHSPAALVVDREGKTIYIADFTAREIAMFDIASESVRRTIAIPGRPSGLALSGDGRRLFVTIAEPEGKVYVVDTAAGTVAASIGVGHTPAGPVLSRDGKILYVCNRFTNDVSVIDAGSMSEAGRIAVSRQPVAARLSPDGNTLFVANQLPTGRSDSDQVGAVISVIDTRKRRVTSEIRLPDGGTGVRDLCLSPDGQYVYVVHVLARHRVPASQIERGWIQTNAVSVVDAVGRKFVSSVLLDDINLGAANPWAVTCTLDAKYLLIAHAGTHEVSVIDRARLHGKLQGAKQGRTVSDVSRSGGDVINDLTFLSGIRIRVPLPGNGPRSLAVVGSKVYAGEYFSGSLGVFDLAFAVRTGARSLPLGPAVAMTPERRGEMLFHDAQYCYQKWLSCSSCHPHEARPDGLNWDLMLDGVGNPKNTKSLLFAHRTPPTTWTGTRPHAEASVRAGYEFIQFAQRPEADALSVDAYLKSLQPVPSPYLEKGKLSAAADRGKQIFQRNGCPGCHSGAYFTGMQKHDVGTGKGSETGTAFDTPSLIEIWRTAPYLHDGRAPTIPDMFSGPDSGTHSLRGRLSRQQIADLSAFILSL